MLRWWSDCPNVFRIINNIYEQYIYALNKTSPLDKNQH